ncbi:MAG: cupin domain-containing protein [Gammaproteobacteria bacterium]|nr:cupin domain-containing protein [Gammaproteobacteria bacterium]
MQRQNLFNLTPQRLPQELCETLLQRQGVRLERIVSHAHTTPPGEWYDQAWDEWVVLLSGSATLKFESGELMPLTPGDHLLIPAHCRHRVESTDKRQQSVWLALHLGADDGTR